MHTVWTQDFLGQWQKHEFATKEEVSGFIQALGMMQAVEIEGAAQKGKIIEYDELLSWEYATVYDRWEDQEGNLIYSKYNPNKDLDFEQYAPVISVRRIDKRHAAYRPYTAGSPEWRVAANHRLAARARAAFANRDRH